MFARLVWVVAITAAILWQQTSAENICHNTWTGDPSSKEETCNIFGTTTLEMICRIALTPPTNISLQWMYTDIRDDAGRNGSVLEMGGSQPDVRSVEVNVINVMGTANQLAATLTIKQEFTLGYYWCMVTGGEDGEYHNPSQVIQISSTCYPDIMCSDNALKTIQSSINRCANGNYEESIDIVDIQDTTGCTMTPLTTDTGIATTSSPPPVDGNAPTTPLTTVDTTMPVPATDDSTSEVTQATGTTDSSGLIAGLPQEIIWLIVGFGTALMLIIIVLLFVIIACLYCSRRRVKDNSTTLPRHFDNLAYQPNEPRITDSFVNPESAKELEVETELNGDHTYAAIPENYTLAAHSGEYSPITRTPEKALTSAATAAGGAHSLPGDYEVVDLDLVTNGAGNKEHQYEVVVNEDTEVSYSRLQRSGSKSHEFNTSISMSGPSVSPVLATSSGGACESTARGSLFGNETPIFDNPKYSQLNKRGNNVGKVDSNPGGRNQNRNEIPALQDEPLVKQKPAHSAKLHASAGDDDYFQDPSLFIVALNETKSPALRDAAFLLPSGHYTSLQDTTMAKESNYTLAIVTSNDKYVSEQGHVYQVLEGAKVEAESAQGKESNLGVADDTAHCAVLKDEEGEEFGFVVSAPGNCARLDNEVTESGSDVGGAIYHTLVHTPPTSDHSREATPPEPVYNVVDRNPKHSTTSRSSMDSGVAYNVIDRKISDGNFNSNLPPAQYDVIELDRSGTTSKKAPSPPMRHNGYSAIAKSSSISGTSVAVACQDLSSSHQWHDQTTSPPPLPPPPSYSSLVDVGRSKHVCNNGNIPIYNTLEQQEENGEVAAGGDVFYHRRGERR